MNEVAYPDRCQECDGEGVVFVTDMDGPRTMSETPSEKAVACENCFGSGEIPPAELHEHIEAILDYLENEFDYRPGVEIHLKPREEHRYPRVLETIKQIVDCFNGETIEVNRKTFSFKRGAAILTIHVPKIT